MNAHKVVPVGVLHATSSAAKDAVQTAELAKLRLKGLESGVEIAREAKRLRAKNRRSTRDKLLGSILGTQELAAGAGAGAAAPRASAASDAEAGAMVAARAEPPGDTGALAVTAAAAGTDGAGSSKLAAGGDDVGDEGPRTQADFAPFLVNE